MKPGPKHEITWVHLHPASFIGGAAEEGGLVLCDDQGGVIELDARNGAKVSEASFGQPLRACVVHADGHKASAPKEGRSPAPPGPGQYQAEKPLSGQIAEALLADDPQLVASQRLLLHTLGDLPDEDATKTLIDLAGDPRTSPALLPDARKELSERKTGASYLEAALATHYDFLRGSTHPPPVGPMAHAVATMKDRAASPLLAEHLLDPADTGDDLREAASALEVVAKPEQMPVLRRFFGMYRANASDGDTVSATVSVAKAMIAVGGKDGLKVVEDAANDANTSPEVKERLEALLVAPPEAPADAGPPHG
jgi:outer membrane protein assembly factor BamB